jgi:hypothetical protein
MKIGAFLFFDGMTEGEQSAMFDTCFDYDDHLRANGHWAGGEALQSPTAEAQQHIQDFQENP